jgi:glycosyltransferase involved in cell wall biosynthesis
MISIIIPVGDNCDRNLDLVLYALTRQTYGNFEVVICADGEKGVEKLAKDHMPHFRVQYSHVPRAPGAHNLGAVNRNRGANLAKSDLLLFLDSSVVLDKHALGYYADDFAKFPNRAIAGPYEWMPPMVVTKYDIGTLWGDFRKKQLPPDPNFPPPYHRVGPDPRQRHFDKSHHDDLYCDYVRSIMLLSGNMAISKRTFWQAGGFWEELTQGIDGAFGLAMCQSGHVWSFDKRCKGYHLYHEKDYTQLKPHMPLIMQRFHSDTTWLGQMNRKWGWPWRDDDWGRAQLRQKRWTEEAANA